MTPKIPIKCPRCYKEGLIEVPAGSGGKLPPVRCPHCGESFQHMIERRLYQRRTPFPWLFYSPDEFELKNRIDFSDPNYRIYRRVFIGELVDVSMTGCKGRTSEHPPNKSENLWLLFRLPDQELELTGGGQAAGTHAEGGASFIEASDPLVHVGGEVVWSRRVSHSVYEFGIRFTHFKDDSESIIETYMFSFDDD